MNKYDLQKEGMEKVKEIVMIMNGLSEEGFRNKYQNDPFFNRGFETLVQLFIQAKFNA